MIKITRNEIHHVVSPISRQPAHPTRIHDKKSGFLNPLVSASVHITGPKTATISVEMDAAYPQYAR